MKRVFGYLRVSGKGQLDGDGFPRQVEIINEHCLRNDLTVVRFFKEKAVSGTVEAVDRPALSEAMALCGGAIGVDTIIVERADRIARDLIVSELFYQEARKLNIKVVEAASGTVLSTEDDTDPTKTMIRQMMGVLAQWEKCCTVKKLRLARERIRATGKKCEGAKLKPLPAEIFPLWDAMQIKHHVEGKSVDKVCRWLNMQTKTFWPRSMVYRWLLDPIKYLEKQKAKEAVKLENAALVP